MQRCKGAKVMKRVSGDRCQVSGRFGYQGTGVWGSGREMEEAVERGG